MAVRIASMALRVFFIINLILGILFWVNGEVEGNRALVNVHMLVGILFVALLWFLGLAQAFKGGSLGLMVGTFAVGLLLAIVGMFQTLWLEDPSLHWIIRALHLLLAVVAIGLGEAASARYKKGAVPSDTVVAG